MSLNSVPENTDAVLGLAFLALQYVPGWQCWPAPSDPANSFAEGMWAELAVFFFQISLLLLPPINSMALPFL